MEKIWQLIRDYWQFVALGILAVLVLVTWWWAQTRQNDVAATTAVVSTVSSLSSSTSSANGNFSNSSSSGTTGTAGYVYISGAIKHPGLYHVKSTTRWADVVQAAGGLTDDADARQLNLARYARDQENLTVPVRGEQAVSVTGDVAAAVSPTANASNDSSTQIDLNTATLEQLQTISGVGPKRAQDILDYRDQHGGFKSVDELKDISGIGDKIFADISPNVTVGGGQ